MKAAIYIRVSTQLQATDRQRTELQEYAALKGYTVTEIYEDMMSGFSDNRPQYSRLKEDAKKGIFDIILFSEMSRMTRKNILLSEVDYFKQNNVQVYFQKQNIHITSEKNDLGTNILLSVLSAISSYETELMKERTTSGKIQKLKSKPYRTGNLSFGYYSDAESTIHVDESKRDIVIGLFTKYAEGWRTSDLVEWLNIEVPDKTWHSYEVVRILKRDIYRGYQIVNIGGQTLNNHYPALQIISDALYERVCAQMQINKRKTSNKPQTNLLNDLLICPHCGRTLRIKYTTKQLHYMCSGNNKFHRETGNGCKSKLSINAKQLESIIWNAVKFASVKANNTINTHEAIEQTEALITDLTTQLGLNQSKLKELDTDLNNYIKRAVKYNLPDSAIDEFNNDIQANKAQVNNNIASLLERLKSAKKQLNNLHKAGDDVSVMALINEAENDTQLKKQYLHEYIDSIRIWSVNGYNVAEIVSNVFNKNIVVWKKYQKGNVRYFEGDSMEMLPVVFRGGLFYDQDSYVEVNMSEVLDLMTENVASVS